MSSLPLSDSSDIRDRDPARRLLEALARTLLTAIVRRFSPADKGVRTMPDRGASTPWKRIPHPGLCASLASERNGANRPIGSWRIGHDGGSGRIVCLRRQSAWLTSTKRNGGAPSPTPASSSSSPGSSFSAPSSSCPSVTSRALRAVLRLGADIALIGAVFAWQIRRIALAELPELRAVEALGVVIALFLVLFSAIYLALSHGNVRTFSEPLDHVRAIYLTITIFSTVGFGDITPPNRRRAHSGIGADASRSGHHRHRRPAALQCRQEQDRSTDGTPTRAEVTAGADVLPARRRGPASSRAWRPRRFSTSPTKKKKTARPPMAIGSPCDRAGIR